VTSIPGVMCCVRPVRVAQRLIAEDFLRCNGGLDALQEECLQIGNLYMDNALMKVQPRPVVVNKFVWSSDYSIFPSSVLAKGR
jgi:hypothetical protein